MSSDDGKIDWDADVIFGVNPSLNTQASGWTDSTRCKFSEAVRLYLEHTPELQRYASVSVISSVMEHMRGRNFLSEEIWKLSLREDFPKQLVI